jgi:hypothetical protein
MAKALSALTLLCASAYAQIAGQPAEAAATAVNPVVQCSGVGATVLSSFLGSDRFTLNVTSEVLAGVQRSFASFSGAAQEASLSRIYAGQHFRTDEVVGQQLGVDVATFVDSNLLTAAGQ